MRVAVGSDHRGVTLKTLILEYLASVGHNGRDCGAYTEEAVDYPDIAEAVARSVAEGKNDYGVLVCGTGIGMSIAANKVAGIRAALCGSVFAAERARQHNDATVLCMAADTDETVMRGMIDAFLTTAFEGGRHQNRVDKIHAIERRCT